MFIYYIAAILGAYILDISGVSFNNKHTNKQSNKMVFILTAEVDLATVACAW